MPVQEFSKNFPVNSCFFRPGISQTFEYFTVISIVFLVIILEWFDCFQFLFWLIFKEKYRIFIYRVSGCRLSKVILLWEREKGGYFWCVKHVFILSRHVLFMIYHHLWRKLGAFSQISKKIYIRGDSKKTERIFYFIASLIWTKNR